MIAVQFTDTSLQMGSTHQRLSETINQYSSIREAIHTISEPHLGIDPRALGAFRITLGALLLVDLIFYRFPGLVTFYTDDGVFPRTLLAEVYPTLETISVHAMFGSALAQGILFLIAGCFAVFLLVGYRTQLSMAISLILLVSLYARNPYLVNGGGTILLTFLFIGMFLPLDARWSLGDSQWNGSDQCVCSLSTAILLLHLVIIYTVNAVYKYQSDTWMSGMAVPRIFHVEEYTVLLGPYLAEYATLLTAINWLWIALLSLSAFLILYTDWLRIGLVAAFISAHFGMAVTMRLGIFPFVMIAGLLLFFPSRVWDCIDGAIQSGLSKLHQSFPFTTRSNQSDGTGEREATSPVIPPQIRKGVRIGSSTLLVCVFVLLVLWQAMGIGLIDYSSSNLDDELSDTTWAFFAPNPPDTSSWYVVEAQIGSGETMDAVDGGEVTFDRPPDAADTYPSTLWSRYGSEIRYSDEMHYEPIAAYICKNMDQNIESVTIYHVEQSVDQDGPNSDPIQNEQITSNCP